MDIFRKYGAKAIWGKNNALKNEYIKFQTAFKAASDNLTFYICAETEYELYINGRLAGFGQFGDYPAEKVYDKIDISEFAVNGENLVSIVSYTLGKNTHSHIAGTPHLIFAAVEENRCILRSDENVKCSAVTEFMSGEVEAITQQRGYNFGFDLRLDDGWRSNFVSAAWKKSVLVNVDKISYIPRPVPKTVIDKPVFGKVITQGFFELSKGAGVSDKMQYAGMFYREDALSGCSPVYENTYLITDLGRELAGHIYLEVEADEGAELFVAIGEHLADLRVRSAVGGRNYGFKCICRDGEQKICFNLKRLAGRYLEIFAFAGIKKVKVGLCPVYYPLPFIGGFKSSDRLFNRIYKVSTETLRLCMHEHYEDCPQREQALYGMDSRNQMLCGYYAFGETAMPRSSLMLLAKSQSDDGSLSMCAPSVFFHIIPSFNLTWIIAVYEYMMFTGDLKFVKALQPVMKKVLEYFIAIKENGLILRPFSDNAWNFYEWTDNMDNIDTLENRGSAKSKKAWDAPLNCFCILALSAYEKVCKELSLGSESVWASECITEIRAAFHNAFYVPQKKAYKNYISDEAESFSQLTQSLALLAGCVPDELEDEIREMLLSDKLTETSLSYLIFKYDALMQDNKKYGEFVLADIEEKWGYMLCNGATSFWETMKGEADFENAGSLCHGWSAVPVYIFWRYVLGVYPESPGVFPNKTDSLCGENIAARATMLLSNGEKAFFEKEFR